MEDGKIKCTNVVIISDCMNHDVGYMPIISKLVNLNPIISKLQSTVHALVSRLISYVKEQLPGHNKLIYFSDGAASQYKNFANLCHHKSYYELATECHFFATSYGKNPCDGLGGTTKRLVAQASLQATVENQILTANQMFEWVIRTLEAPSISMSTSMM